MSDRLASAPSSARPLDLRAGGPVDLLATGAYPASSASRGLNGFAPLPVYCIDGPSQGPVGAAR